MKNQAPRINEINMLQEGFVTAFSRFTNIIGDRIIAPHGHPELWELVPYDPDARLVPDHPPLAEKAVVGCPCVGCIQNRKRVGLTTRN